MTGKNQLATLLANSKLSIIQTIGTKLSHLTFKLMTDNDAIIRSLVDNPYHEETSLEELIIPIMTANKSWHSHGDAGAAEPNTQALGYKEHNSSSEVSAPHYKSIFFQFSVRFLGQFALHERLKLGHPLLLAEPT